MIKVGARVAISRIADGATLAVATVEKVTDREIRTETPYEQRQSRHEMTRRHWRSTAPHTELRVPRDEKATREPCAIRPATEADEHEALRRVAVRRAKERMPSALRHKEEHERRIALAEDALRREREPYERLLRQIEADEKIIAEAAT